MINQLKNNVKHLIGWKTKRKIVVFSVDDYGNVRTDSMKALIKLKKLGLGLGRFDEIDSMETRQDLEGLFQALTSVTDINGNHAVITPFTVPCNIDFNKMSEDNYQNYHSELLPDTFRKLASRFPAEYEGAWDLWKEGISKGILVPQFHGREHFNLKDFEEKLKNKDPQLIAALQNFSNVSLPNSKPKVYSFFEAFGFWEFNENQRFESVIGEGLDAFETIFGNKAKHFMAPGGVEHHSLHKTLKINGIDYIDNPLIKKEHQGLGKFKIRFNYTGKKDDSGIMYMVRNSVYEPTLNKSIDWNAFAMKQIERAFSWNKPAIISSHRANFCGHIDPGNRTKGLKELRELLLQIKKKWPEVEFMSANHLGDLIDQQKNHE